MVKIARKSDPRRLAELKKKINDEKYIAMAIARLAQELTRSLIQED